LIIDEGEQENLDLESTEKSHFFYVDDFFHWLGCKFVTCDKENKKDDNSESDKDKEKENSVITIHETKKEDKK